jgi:hypothetical protein
MDSLPQVLSCQITCNNYYPCVHTMMMMQQIHFDIKVGLPV